MSSLPLLLGLTKASDQKASLKSSALCCLQAGCRSVVDVDYFLILHHLVQCAFPVLAFQSQSPFVLKLTTVISCFASYEFLLHAALICSKMPVLRKWFRWLTIIGLVLYIATRLLQTFFIVLLFVAGYKPMNTSQTVAVTAKLNGSTASIEVPGHSAKTIAVYWIALFMCIVITAQQMWKLVIYRNLWRSTTAAARPVRTSSGTIKVPRASSGRTARASRGQAHHSADSLQQVRFNLAMQLLDPEAPEPTVYACLRPGL